MPKLSTSKIGTLLTQGDNADTSVEKGRALEELISYVFGQVPGISVTRRNVVDIHGTTEIDVAFWNDRVSNGLHFLGYNIVVECKNCEGAVGSQEVAWFDRKIRDRGLDFGILVASNGITGDASDLSSARDVISTALREGRRLVVVTRADIEGMQTTDDVVQLMKEKLTHLFADRAGI